eukprot:4150300-Lingulodinium_polyedra.AAC.1
MRLPPLHLVAHRGRGDLQLHVDRQEERVRLLQRADRQVLREEEGPSQPGHQATPPAPPGVAWWP